jgi:hypothetical protein
MTDFILNAVQLGLIPTRTAECNNLESFQFRAEIYLKFQLGINSILKSFD